MKINLKSIAISLTFLTLCFSSFGCDPTPSTTDDAIKACGKGQVGSVDEDSDSYHCKGFFR